MICLGKHCFIRATERQIMNILPGTKISLETVGGNRVNVTLLGMVANAYVVLREVPARSGLMDFSLNYGEQVVLRFLHEGTATGFRSYVLNMVREPERLLFVAYPTEIQRLPLRRADRVKCTLPAQIALNGELFIGVLADMSETGCQYVLRNSDLTELDDGVDLIEVEVDISAPGMDGEMVGLSGTVQRALRDERRLRLGIQFEERQSELFNELKDALNLLEGL